jgi:hypothetical protein
MRTRKPSDVSFPVPKLGFQTDELVDTLIEALRQISPSYRAIDMATKNCEAHEPTQDRGDEHE